MGTTGVCAEDTSACQCRGMGLAQRNLGDLWRMG